MDDFERAVIISFSGTADTDLQERATAFVGEIKRSPEVWKLCLERFSVSAYSEVKFWCLQTLQEVIRTSYTSLHASTRDMIKQALLVWVTQDCTNTQVPLPAFLRNKVAQTLVSVLQHEYPSVWPGFFQDLLRVVLPGSQLAAAGVGGRPSGTLGAVQPGGESMVDMLCRILVSVDEDLVSLDIPRSQDESKLSMHVKDSMREHSIADIAAAWQLLVESYAQKSPDLAALVLNTMQRYVPWIDISLVANDKFVALLESIVDSASYPANLRGAAADCLAEVVTKRMEAVPKLNLIQGMGIVPHCAAWVSALPLVATDDTPIEADDLVYKLAKLLAAIAGELMDSLKRVENGVISLTAMGLDVSDEAAQEAGSAAQRATQLLDQLFPALLAAFRSEVAEVALPLLPFMSAYAARLKTLQKRNETLNPSAVAHVHAIFEGIAGCARFPRNSAYNGMEAGRGAATSNGGPLPATSKSAMPAAAKDEQAEVDEKRRDLFVLFRNLGKTAYGEALQFLGRLLQQAIVQPAPGSRADLTTWQDVEIALTLLYEIGEAGIDDMCKPDCGSLAPLVTALAQSCAAAGQQANGGPSSPTSQQAGAGQSLGIRALPHNTHPLVSLVVLELLVRYGKVFQQSPALLPGVLLTFFDSRGMDHAVEEVSTRACYLFSRLSKQLRSTLRPYLPSVLPTLQPILARVATTPVVDTSSAQVSRDTASKATAPVNAMVDDRLYVFEAVGLLLGQEDVPPEEQAAALGALLQPLTSQIQANLRSAPGGAAAGPAAPGMIIQALEAVVRINKGFKTDLVTRQRPQLGRMFSGVMEVALSVPRQYPEHRLLRARFISCVHRLVEGLQGLLLPFLPAALEALVGWPQADPTDLTDVLVLANQLVCRFKEGLAPLMEGLLPIVISRLHALLGSDGDWSGRRAAPSPVLLAPAGPVTTIAAAGSAGMANGVAGGRAGGAAGSAPVAAATQGAVAATLEEERERGELQRAYYSLLHSIAHHGCSGVLLQHDPHVVLEPVMMALTRGAASHVDPAVRRTCVQVYCRLITEWCSSGSAEAIPGFKRYAMEHLGGEACVLGVLQSQPPLDPRDGSTMALLQDLATALKLVYDRCGEDFANHLLSVVGPAAGLPPAVVEQLVAHVRVSEAKDVRDCLRALLLQTQRGK